jgi:hypothetical protein
LLALFCWLGIPLISHANWLDLFHSINELVLLVLALGLLSAGAVIAKGVLIWSARRMRRKTG